MDGSYPTPGFDNHVWNQLQQMSHQPSQRGRGGRGNWGGRGRGRNHRGYPSSHGSQSSFMSNQSSVQHPPNTADFPPLGSALPLPARNAPAPQYQQYQAPVQPFDNIRHGTPREYQERARANYRGYEGRFGHQSHVQPAAMNQYPTYGRPLPRHTHLYNPNAEFHHGTAEQQRHMRHVLMRQSDYLTAVGRKANEAHRLTREESVTKENFRLDLEGVAKEALSAKYPELDVEQVKLKCYGSLANGFALANCDMDLLLSLPGRQETVNKTKSSDDQTEPDEDLDSDEDEERTFNVEVRRVLEKAFLDKSYGARLLTNTRVPILRICERPSSELLHNLRDHRAAWEKSLFQSVDEVSTAPYSNDNSSQAVAKSNEQNQEDPNSPVLDSLDQAAHESSRVLHSTDPETMDQSTARPLNEPARGGTLAVDSLGGEISNEPTSTVVEEVDQAMADLTVKDLSSANPATRGNPNLDFAGDCGIQCDINFTNFVALHNSALLRLYQGFDPRVGEVGTFVKIWAKARDINTPYRGTLSSYAYIMMVLHYLMNIASPPVIPNLQYLAKIEDGWNPDKEIPLFDGFDIRFVSRPAEIQQLQKEMARNKNKETTAQLIRGFFRYYATREGFFWTRDAISIRQKGGIVSKAEKGWTEAKWAESKNKNVRLRYLLAIEDPFEVEHNVARTVGHHGLVSIRDEFRRAWSMVERVGAGEQISVEAFLKPVTDRIDTLRKDQDFHRQKQLQMKRELEAKEKLLAQKKDDEDSESHTDGTLGNSNQGRAQALSSLNSQRRNSNSKLTSAHSHQGKNKDKNNRQTSESWRRRKVSADSDSEDDGEENRPVDKGDHPAEDPDPSVDANSDKPEAKEKCKPDAYLCSRTDVLLANGRDEWGNPVPWDVDTQEGRWLHWRDKKIKKGTIRGFQNPTLRELDEQCPFDAQRPTPYFSKPYNSHVEKMQAERPPWPASHVDHPCHSVVKSDNPFVESAPFIPQSSEWGEQTVTDASPDQGPPIPSPHGRQDGVVGKVIPWDNRTRGGDWLRWRDRCIRNGHWQHHQYSRYTELSNEFPYDELMTWAQLEEKNKVLRKYYSRTTYRIDVPENSALGLAEKPAATDTNHVSLATTNSVTAQSQGINHNVDLVPGRNTSSPDQEALRARRLAFFAKQFTGSESDAVSNANTQSCGHAAHNGPNEVGEESIAPAYDRRIAVQPISRESGFADSTQWNAAVELEEVVDNDSQSFHSANGLQEDNFTEDQGSPDERTYLQVPETLYPDMDRNQRPRDEDPDVMPIPRNYGFQFDPRQLQDLAIIAKGGNGCAREGAQFSIEDEYEWGGGGAMGWRTSTGPQCVRISSGTPYLPGQGDEDRLLDELPGDLD
ncbi:hypothetical protein LTR47_008772 [Exophiala xenobiotica]|nr:hypothetical protein LTR47_008772 [Exophiala xenobiotica]KAK5253301.1 hypothetical protein LTS06_002265 [Exophiala xenobiotica]KAK5283388.1 hypothetical protein LTR40_001852 [Exophiala xenobiotica]KAK5346403.1 hypothetical protein LTR61_009844 [Exophiala xenobiotica]KAK5360052.1 hypothetical protein LTR11_010338 [Exophiala xenobiotica]